MKKGYILMKFIVIDEWLQGLFKGVKHIDGFANISFGKHMKIGGFV